MSESDCVSALDEVFVYYWRSGSLSTVQQAALLPLLSQRERRCHDRLGFASDRRDYAAAHVLLRRAVSAHVDIAPDRLIIGADERGKPRIDALPQGTTLGVSLSHSHGIVACAVSRACNVGIDVESVDSRVTVETVARLFTPAEQAQLAHGSLATRRTRFYELWTLKEALFKAEGIGVGAPLDAASFCIDGDRVNVITRPPLSEKGWTFRSMSLNDTHVLSVAARAARPRSNRMVVTEISTAV